MDTNIDRDEAVQQYFDQLKALAEEFQKLADHLAEILRPFVHDITVLFTILHPERQEWESLTAYARRLELAGMLDDPDIRWMYQTEVMRTVADRLGRFLPKLGRGDV